MTFAYGAATRCCTTCRSRSRAGERIALVGPDRCGQVDARQADRPLLRPDRGRRARRRRRPARRDARARCASASSSCRRKASCSPGTLRDNVRVGRPEATDAEVDDALARARAARPVPRVPRRARRPRCASAARACRRASASSCRSRAPRSPTRRSSCSTKRRRTSTPAPSTRSRPRSSGSCTGRTVVVVAHRLSTAARADRIAVVYDGRLVRARHPRASSSRATATTPSLYRAWTAHHAEPVA